MRQARQPLLTVCFFITLLPGVPAFALRDSGGLAARVPSRVS